MVSSEASSYRSFEASVEVALRDVHAVQDGAAELEAFHPAFSVSARGWTVVHLQVMARTEDHAARVAVAVVVAALDAEPLAWEVGHVRRAG